MNKIKCRNCKKSFFSYKSHRRIFCKRKCKTLFAYKGNTCRECGKNFKTIKSRKGFYCSHKCANFRGPHSKGGKIIDNFGYVHIWQPFHPFCNKKGYIKEHRLVMEGHIKRFLTKKEVVHHKNGKRSDNRIINLQLFPSHSEHMKNHGFNRGIKYWGSNARLA